MQKNEAGQEDGQQKQGKFVFREKWLCRKKEQAALEREIERSIPRSCLLSYRQGMKEAEDVLAETIRQCGKATLLISFLIIAQLELVPKFASEYIYMTMPLHIKFLSLLVNSLAWWLPIFALGLFTVFVLLNYRPAKADAYLFRLPVLRKITIPLYFFRYFWIKTFTRDKDLAGRGVGNHEFQKMFQNREPEFIRTVSEPFPTLALVIKKEDLIHPADELLIAEYAKDLLMEACFDFRESYSYICIAVLAAVSVLVEVAILT